MIRHIAILVVAIPVCCMAQDTITLHKLKQSDIFPLYTKSSKSNYSAYLFTVGEEPLRPIGLRGENLEPYLKGHPEAYQTFLDYRVQTRRARTTSVVGSLGSLAGFGVLVVGVTRDDVSDAVIGASLGVIVASAVVQIIGRKKYRKARDTFERSVDIYNENGRSR